MVSLFEAPIMLYCVVFVYTPLDITLNSPEMELIAMLLRYPSHVIMPAQSTELFTSYATSMVVSFSWTMLK